MNRAVRTGVFAALALSFIAPAATAGDPDHSVARRWNDALLEAIRKDFARPTVHARNLYHTSVAMWDAWAVYDDSADPVLIEERVTAEDIDAARHEAISYAAYRVLSHRFQNSPGAATSLPLFDALMNEFGYDINDQTTTGDSPVAVGNRCAQAALVLGTFDNANEVNDYANQSYQPINPPLLPDFPGNPNIVDPNRWQPLALQWFVDQAGVQIGEYPDFLSPEWGQVTPFALTSDDLTVYQRDGFDYWVYHDPGPPPYFGAEGDDYYKWGAEQVVIWSSHLDPGDGVEWDISPKSIGNATLPDADDWESYYDLINGGDWGTGYDLNPVTGQPYAPQMVPRGDYARILAEFWADGPDSETPPGHWFTILNYVSDHPMTVKQLGGEGPILDDLEWDVKTYLAMGGAMHDSAISAWGVKGWYDYIRPVSAIRYLADNGVLPLRPGYIEIVTSDSVNEGRHAHLAAHVGKVAILAWRGHNVIINPESQTAGVDWILAENWWPYQRPTFVTPPFAGYVSGHSTYSRAAAEVMTLLTGSPWFPGGLGEFHCPAGEFLVFEDGPSIDVTLQWASYRDASDQCSLSRIWGGIHPGADDLPGRQMGQAIGPDSFNLAVQYYNGQVTCRGDLDESGSISTDDLTMIFDAWGECAVCAADLDRSGRVDVDDLLLMLNDYGSCPDLATAPAPRERRDTRRSGSSSNAQRSGR